MLLGFIPTVFADEPSPCRAGTGGVDLGDCLKLSDSSRVSDTYYNPAVLVNLFVSNLFVIAGIILFLFIIVAGFKFITGGQKGAEDAKNILTTGLIGFIIMFASYWIIQIIALLTGVTISGVNI